MFTNSVPEKPGLVQAMAILTLVSGMVNIVWGIIVTGAIMATLIGIVCVPITIWPTILGLFEVIYAARLLSTPPQVKHPSPTLAALEIACILAGNVFSTIVGVLMLVFYHDPLVKEYFQALNAPRKPESAPDVLPPSRKVA